MGWPGSVGGRLRSAACLQGDFVGLAARTRRGSHAARVSGAGTRHRRPICHGTGDLVARTRAGGCHLCGASDGQNISLDHHRTSQPGLYSQGRTRGCGIGDAIEHQRAGCRYVDGAAAGSCRRAGDLGARTDRYLRCRHDNRAGIAARPRRSRGDDPCPYICQGQRPLRGYLDAAAIAPPVVDVTLRRPRARSRHPPSTPLCPPDHSSSAGPRC